MRDIKFRGRRLSDGQWVYGYYYHVGTPYPAIVYATKEGLCGEDTVTPDTVGQYTGLRDRNGKEIYEGDICSGGMLRCNGGYSTYTDKATVSFQDGIFKLGSISLISFASQTEVIGNVHENPELLAKADEQQATE